jgi:molybdopterin-guanine dinucleotide biosynthesis protein A
MGKNKAELIFGGEPLVAHVARRLSSAVDELLVIGPQSLARHVPQARVVADVLPEMGPLGGLYTALTVTTSASLFLAACDMPFVNSDLVRAMLALAEAHHDNADVIVLHSNGRVQPLHAVYARTCLPAVENALTAKDHSLHVLIAQLAAVAVETELVQRVDPDGLSALNVNTPNDLQHALRLSETVDRQRQLTDGQ